MKRKSSSWSEMLKLLSLTLGGRVLLVRSFLVVLMCEASFFNIEWYLHRIMVGFYW
jgi:hypothetical protein